MGKNRREREKKGKQTHISQTMNKWLVGVNTIEGVESCMNYGHKVRHKKKRNVHKETDVTVCLVKTDSDLYHFISETAWIHIRIPQMCLKYFILFQSLLNDMVQKLN